MLPLLHGYAGMEAPFAYRGTDPVSVRAFLGAAHALAQSMSGGPTVNLCADRYLFTVGFAAALVRGSSTLLPPSDAPGVLASLAEDYPSATILHDGGNDHPGAIDIRNLPLWDTSDDIPAIPENRIAAVLFTSGSTGRPRPQPKTWGAMVASTRAAGARLVTPALAGATLLGTVPHQHSYGIESTVMLALQHGLTLHSKRPLLPADILQIVDEAPRPRILITAPIHLRALLSEGHEFPALDLIVSATAPLSPQIAQQAETAFQACLLEIYGCSEAGQIATRRTAVEENWTCLPGIVLRQEGDTTFAAGTPIGADTPLNDVIDLADETYFTLLGRTADMINIAGKRSSLAHLNYVLNAIPGVQDGAFLAQDNDSSRLTAFAVAPALSVAHILAALRQHIDPAFLPRPLHLVDALPRNALGKLTREAALRLAAEAATKPG